MSQQKSETDKFWNARAHGESDQAKVNIADTVQRDHELQFVFRNLAPSMRVLEVGCGNGYVTQQLRARVAHVDAFDYAENMIERAKAAYGETNNRFFQDSVIAPERLGAGYDAAICIRVLINLRNVDEQAKAIANIAGALKPGGRLILIEGYREGFDAINATRQAVGLPPAQPAAINFYSYLGELMPAILSHFRIESTWHTGMFDFLTRIVYPMLAGDQNAREPGEFHAKIEPLVRANALPDLATYARLVGLSLVRAA